MASSDKLDHRPPAPSAPRAEPDDGDVEDAFRDIHPEPSPPPMMRQPSWDAASHRSLSSSGDQFTSMSREFTAMVAAAGADDADDDLINPLQLGRIGEEHELAPPASTTTADETSSTNTLPAGAVPTTTAAAVRKEEVEAKVAAWQAEEVAKINNKFKREEVVINGWETQQIHKSTASLAKIERRLEGERAKATEKARNAAAAARRKAEERRAEAEARRGRKTAEVLDRANFCKAAGKLPSKRSFFSFT
uniref:Remorin C-terminal domain-containing protein n=1 Tax=Leersia perrieri TaxID=77586 RepID=A0A0D9WWR1_9ORYZ